MKRPYFAPRCKVKIDPELSSQSEWGICNSPQVEKYQVGRAICEKLLSFMF